MVLSRVLCAMLVIATIAASIAGCGQSLFDAYGDRRDGGPGDDGGGGDDGPDVPDRCPDTCLADAAKDLDKSTSPWRHLEEGPSHTWLEMDRMGNEFIGNAEPSNRIRRCIDDPSASACQGLPDALLVSTAGNSSAHVPALEFTATSAQVLHLIIRAHVPNDSAPQNVRLYRNGREDVLFTILTLRGTVEREVVVDALPGDRFLVAVEPISTDTTGGTAALHFFVSSMGETFPSTCQFAATFETASGNVVEDLCSTRDLTSQMGAGMAAPPLLTSSGGPFPLLGKFVTIPSGYYLHAPYDRPLVRNRGPLTLQFWVRVTNAPSDGWAVSDLDVDFGGGVGLDTYGGSSLPWLQVQAASSILASGTVTIGSGETRSVGGEWRFVRIIDAPGSIKVCVNGAPAISMTAAPNRPESMQALHLGKMSDVQSTALFDGALDDVRVFSTALPCTE